MRYIILFAIAISMAMVVSCNRRDTVTLSDNEQATLLEAKADSLVRKYQYAAAADTYRDIIDRFGHAVDSSDLADYNNSLQLYGALAMVPSQVMHKPGDVTIASYQNEFSHLMLPVRCGGRDDRFIFDTGANLSTITRSVALDMGLKLIESDISVGSSTDIEVTSQLAVADSIEVGGILFEHVVFLVLADDMLSFPSIGYEIHGIIGFPVISQMEEIRMNADGTIFTPFESIDRGFENLRFDGLNMIVALLHDDDTLQFFLDTGANMSQLSKKYYDEHEEEIKAKATLQHSHRGGAGGIVEVDEYVLRDFAYAVGSQHNVMEQMAVSLEEKHSEYDGVMGQDIFGQFGTMILNFKYMYLDLE